MHTQYLVLLYRHNDAPLAVDSLLQSLRDHFDSSSLLILDSEEIQNLRIDMESLVSGCQALIAIIGPGWLSAATPLGERLIEQPDDPLRKLLSHTLQARRPVIPLILADALSPPVNHLPVELAALFDYDDVSLRPGCYYELDLKRLIQKLEQFIPATEKYGVSNPIEPIDSCGLFSQQAAPQQPFAEPEPDLTQPQLTQPGLEDTQTSQSSQDDPLAAQSSSQTLLDEKRSELADLSELGSQDTPDAVDQLMTLLVNQEDSLTAKLVDHALGLVRHAGGQERLLFYLYHGLQIQRNYAALYFKRRDQKDILDQAFQAGVIDEIQAHAR